MAVSAQTPWNRYTANGVSTVFAYSFRIPTSADLSVLVDDVEQSLGVDYTLSGVNDPSGGNVTFTTAPDADAIVELTRTLDVDRDTNYQTNGDLLATTVNADLDRILMLVQQVNDIARRALRNPRADGSLMNELPVIASRAGKYLVFDASGHPTVSAGSVSGADVTLRADLASSSDILGAALVGNVVQVVNDINTLRGIAPTNTRRMYTKGHTVAGVGQGLFRGVTGAAPGTYTHNNGTIVVPSGGDGSAAWLLEYGAAINAKQFGCLGDGVNDTVALLALVAATATGAQIYFPKGNYKTTAKISFGANVNVFGDGIHTSIISSTSDITIVEFAEDNFQFEGISIYGPGDPALTNSIGLLCSTRIVDSVKVGAQNYAINNVYVRNCYIGASFEGSANSLISNLNVNGCYSVGIRCYGAQGKWNSLNVSACYSHGLLLSEHPTSALNMAAPFLSNIETFANGGFGIKVTQGMGLQLTNAFLNNDSDGEIWFDTNTLAEVGQIVNAILQFAGDNPFDPRNDASNPFTGDKNAPAILCAAGTKSVCVSNTTTFNNAGCDIKTDGQTAINGCHFEGCGAGIPARGAFPAIPADATDIFSLVTTGGANIVSGSFLGGAVKIAGSNNVLSASAFSNNSATVPTLEVVAGSVNNVFSGLNVYQNNGAGTSIKTVATSSYYAAAIGAPAGATSLAGTLLPSSL